MLDNSLLFILSLSFFVFFYCFVLTNSVANAIWHWHGITLFLDIYNKFESTAVFFHLPKSPFGDDLRDEEK